MSVLDPIKPYWLLIKWGALAIGVALALSWVYGKGYDAAELKHLKATQSLIDGEVKHRVAADKALAEALKKTPATGRKVNDAVRAHPTSPDCVVPDDVVQQLQDGIRAGAANTAE